MNKMEDSFPSPSLPANKWLQSNATATCTLSVNSKDLVFISLETFIPITPKPPMKKLVIRLLETSGLNGF